MKRPFVALTAVLLFSHCASWILARSIAFERGRADLEERSVEVGRFRFVYTEGGKGPAVLLVHGFAGDKDHWTRFAAHLTDSYRVIAPDLPGHGESDKHPDESYSVSRQTERLHAFVETLKPGKFHLVGSSMGGAIAAYYASKHQGSVASLTLIDAAGVESPEKSALALALEKGENPLLVGTAADFDRMLRFTTVKQPYIPGPIKAHFARRAVRNRPIHEKIFADIRAEQVLTRARLAAIRAPTLILWGDTDRVIHPSAGRVFQNSIRDSELIMIKDCGHAPMIEQPGVTAGHFRRFLAENRKKMVDL